VPNTTIIRSTGSIVENWSATTSEYPIACSWTHDGHGLIAADAAGEITSYDALSGAPIWTVPGSHDSGLLALSIHPKKARLASSGQDGCVSIWNGSDGTEISAFDLSEQWAEHISWSPKGRLLAASAGRDLFLIEPSSKTVHSLGTQPSTIAALAWCNDKELAVAHYGGISLFSAKSVKMTRRFEWKGSLVSMELCPRGEIIACGSQDNSVHFWRKSTGADAQMSGYPGKPTNLAFDSRGLLLATGGREVVTIWNFADGGPEGTRPTELDMHSLPITCLSFSPTQPLLASGARDGSVMVWSVDESGEGVPRAGILLAERIESIAWSPNGNMLSATSGAGQITTWQLET
jgi:WD40 repeat protein